MKYQFTIIQHASSNSKLDHSMSIGATGRIGLGRDFTKAQNLAAGSRAQMYWDASSQTIAIVFPELTSGVKSEGYRRVTGLSDYTVAFVHGDAGYILAAGFFKTIDLNPADYLGQYRYEETTAKEAGIDAPEDAAVFLLHIAKS